MPIKRKSLAARKPKKVAQPKIETEKEHMETQIEEAKPVEVTPAETEAPKPVKSAARKERIPLGTPRLKLSAPERPGYRRRWINDVGGRLEQAQEGDYEFVTDDGYKIGETAIGSGNQDLGKRISRIVGKNDDGSPIRAYLMEIRDEFYQQDQAEKQKRLDEIDNQIRKGRYNPENDTDMNRYVPKEGITYK